MKMKILYLPCHSVHEYDEVRMFHEMGHEIFSPGAYFNPQSDEFLRPGIPGLVYDENVVKQYDDLGKLHPGKDQKDHLTKEFVDNFDTVLVMSLSRWVQGNWDAIKHKNVILRTNGQSDESYERFVSEYRKYGNFKVVRYSPYERYFPNYGGEDAMIRFGKKLHEYPLWEGDNLQLSTLVQDMKGRSEACSWEIFLELSKRINCKLYGMSNEDAGDLWFGKKTSLSETLDMLKYTRAYFYGGTKPANYTLNFIEALCVGCPIVALGDKLGNLPGQQTYEITNIIENGTDGFCGDSVDELVEYTQELFDNPTLAKTMSDGSRRIADKLFNEKNKKLEWNEFFKQLI